MYEREREKKGKREEGKERERNFHPLSDAILSISMLFFNKHVYFYPVPAALKCLIYFNLLLHSFFYVFSKFRRNVFKFLIVS